MAWLNHSTNNIILDAVLTDYGRQQLSLANSSFNVTHFALGDDEIDYRVIKKYGRAVGKEKIEKNTPIFEASTILNIALKYKLIGRETTGTALSQIFMPVLSASPASIDLSTTATANLTSKAVTLTLSYRGSSDPSVIADVAQTAYSIKVSDRFCTINSAVNGTLTTPEAARSTIVASDPSRTSTYILSVRQPSQTVSFTVSARAIDPTTAAVYGKRTSSTQRTITTYITVSGNRHGVTVDIPVTYTLISA